MVNILQTEFFRLKKSKLFWAMFGVCAGLPLLSLLTNLLNVVLLQSMDLGVEIDNAWQYMRAMNVTGAELSALPNLASDCSLFALICTSIFLSKEFSGGTFRNMLLANRSRRQLYVSYLIVACTIGSTYLGTTFVTTLLFSGSIFGFGTMKASSVITACVLSLALGLVSVIFLQTMMCMFMFATRKLAVALACPLVISILVPSLVYSFVDTFAQFGVITVGDMSWIPLYNLNLLDLTNVDGALIGKILLYIIPFAALFGYLGWISFKKADLK